MRTTVCYFTGTGNSYYAAKACAKSFPNASLFSIMEIKADPSLLDNTTTLGLVFPVYWLAPPHLVARFITEILAPHKLPLDYLFMVNTNGGLSGYAMMITERLFARAGYVPSYSASVKMVDTYIPFYRIPSAEKQAKIYKKADSKLAGIQEELRNHEIRVPWRVPLISLYEHIWGKNRKSVASRDTRFVVDSTCTGCGICADLCPACNIIMNNGKPEFTHACEQCLGCYHHCPVHAITFTHKPLQGYTWFPNPYSEYESTRYTKE
jgi:ferredoxin